MISSVKTQETPEIIPLKKLRFILREVKNWDLKKVRKVCYI
jgi:hypothetical protein